MAMAGKQALHKSLHSHLQFFAHQWGKLLIQHSHSRGAFLLGLYDCKTKAGKQNRSSEKAPGVATKSWKEAGVINESSTNGF